MRIAQADLGLDQLGVVHAGMYSYELAPGIKAIAFNRMLEDLKPLR